MLRRLRPGLGTVPVLPVPSNVGEPGEITPFLEREPVAAVFGQTRRRLDVYQGMHAFLPLLQRAGIRAFEDVGPPLPAGAYAGLPWPVRVHGVAAPGRVTELLSKSRFGLLRLPSHLLGKSGCFAAYAAHGVVCLLLNEGRSAAQELAHGRHFLEVPSSKPQPLDEAKFEAVAAAAFRWYSGHRVERSAGTLARVLIKCAC
jgi:hypothetical protein